MGRRGGSCAGAAWLLLATALAVVEVGGALRSTREPRLLLVRNVTLWEADRAFLHSATGVARFEVSSESCSLARNFSVDLAAQEGLRPYATDTLGFEWYLFCYRFQGRLFHLIFGGDVATSLSFAWPELEACGPPHGLSFAFADGTEAAVSYDADFLHSSPYPTLPSLGLPGGERRRFRTARRHDAAGTVHAFVPIGMMVLFVGVCVRCCHYCRYKHQLHKRTRDALDAAAQEETFEVVSTTTAAPLNDSPPKYDDVCDADPPPPSYADLFQVVAAAAEKKELEGQALLQEGDQQGAEEPLETPSSTELPTHEERAALIPASEVESESLAMTETSAAASSTSSSESDAASAARPATSSVRRTSPALRAWASLNHARLKTHFAFRRLVEERDDQRPPSPSAQPK